MAAEAVAVVHCRTQAATDVVANSNSTNFRSNRQSHPLPVQQSAAYRPPPSNRQTITQQPQLLYHRPITTRLLHHGMKLPNSKNNFSILFTQKNHFIVPFFSFKIWCFSDSKKKKRNKNLNSHICIRIVCLFFVLVCEFIIIYTFSLFFSL